MPDYTQLYDPLLTIQHPEFRVLPNDIPVIKDVQQNLACFYNDKKEIHLVEKPFPLAREGEVIVHVTASGICGSECVACLRPQN